MQSSRNSFQEKRTKDSPFSSPMRQKREAVTMGMRGTCSTKHKGLSSRRSFHIPERTGQKRLWGLAAKSLYIFAGDRRLYFKRQHSRGLSVKHDGLFSSGSEWLPFDLFLFWNPRPSKDVFLLIEDQNFMYRRCNGNETTMTGYGHREVFTAAIPPFIDLFEEQFFDPFYCI
uniref:Uncharacterized protein n=1 Tax=Romanomermis culicivorax TaxID=13658 RepID=A0A915K3T2_ROMCU